MLNSMLDREQLAAFLMTVRTVDGMTPRVLTAVESVPRRLFVPQDAKDAYCDKVFPIDCGQSMPGARHAVRLVAALKIAPEHRVLEVGTGSGYITALMAKLCVQVLTLDRYQTLLTKAQDRLKSCGIGNVTYLKEDGRTGYPDQAPFDRIVVHGSFEMLPRNFVEQTSSQGILLCALGDPSHVQRVVRHQRLGSRFEEETLFHARLQPLETGVASYL
ncbi:hypothetical protein NS365_00115 [Aureimonas ureilytica]|uniref:Protein-L-isoaspartate O-methyltransferase n=2 Tax=Aureimonas ureilytica TaxID=401562 RepID=A0A147DB50_9HYPH|nr:hypothetical protein NS365_00115 [Aureimonas ureilytica]